VSLLWKKRGSSAHAEVLLGGGIRDSSVATDRLHRNDTRENYVIPTSPLIVPIGWIRRNLGRNSARRNYCGGSKGNEPFHKKDGIIFIGRIGDVGKS
jgi:hypothetical protein